MSPKRRSRQSFFLLFIENFRSRKFSSHENLDRVLRREEGKRWSHAAVRTRGGRKGGGGGNAIDGRGNNEEGKGRLVGLEHHDDHASSTKDAEIAADFGRLFGPASRKNFSDEQLGKSAIHCGVTSRGGGGELRRGERARDREGGDREEETKERFEDTNFEASLGYLP